MPNITKPRTGRDYRHSNHYLALAGLWGNGGVPTPTPAVVLRFTAGYAVHIPSGVKREKQKFH
ncbi:MAG: hypothetical protein LBE12_06160 [Planctomycetaceae bacterium]|nr:hypothetical protein [Planctomycetaceae bacterium]